MFDGAVSVRRVAHSAEDMHACGFVGVAALFWSDAVPLSSCSRWTHVGSIEACSTRWPPCGVYFFGRGTACVLSAQTTVVWTRLDKP